MVLPSIKNAFETSVLSLSLIVLSAGYLLGWNTDGRLAGGKWRFILDNDILSSLFSRQLVRLSSSLSTQTHTHTRLLSHTNTSRGPGNLFNHFFCRFFLCFSEVQLSAADAFPPLEQMTWHNEPSLLHLNKQEV